MGEKLRVVVWSTGTIGRHAIAGIDAHPKMELVGVWVSNPEKDGKDAGILADLGRELGVKATTDRDALIALKPDAILHTAMADDRVFECIEDLFGFVEAGINVVSSGPVLLQWPENILPETMLDRLAEAGRKTGASLHVNGIDPGYANDLLPLALTSLSQRTHEVRVMEIADYSTYYQPVVMGDMFGFGRPMDFRPLLWEPGLLSVAWGSVVRRVDGVDRLVLEHVTRTHPDQMPEWPQPAEGGGGYRVIVTGEPFMQIDFTHHGEHGDHNVSGMITTAQRIVNAVPAVVAAPGGLVTALDLPLVTGRGLVAK